MVLEAFLVGHHYGRRMVEVVVVRLVALENTVSKRFGLGRMDPNWCFGLWVG